MMPTPAASREALEITQPKRTRAPLSRTLAMSAGVLILIATGFGVNAMKAREAARETQTRDSATATKPPSMIPAPAVATGEHFLPDSAARDSIAAVGAKTAARAPIKKLLPKSSERILRVIGPADATINVDGAVVGRGTWHSENITTGVHHVVVSFNAPAACGSAHDTKDVRVSESGTTTVQLSPRRCGTFTLDAAPTGGRYVLSSGGHEVTSGAVPVTSPVLVPEGTYALRVSAKYCADYSGSVTISTGSTAHERVRLICQ
jgi:hypothetical protein